MFKSAYREVPEKQFNITQAVIGLVFAVLASYLAALVMFFITDAIGMMPDSVKVDKPDGSTSAIGAADIPVSIIFPWVIGGVIFVLLRLFTKQPLRIFLIAAVVGFLLSLISPLTIDGAPAKMVIALYLMHAAAAVAGVYTLYRYILSRP